MYSYCTVSFSWSEFSEPELPWIHSMGDSVCVDFSDWQVLLPMRLGTCMFNFPLKRLYLRKERTCRAKNPDEFLQPTLLSSAAISSVCDPLSTWKFLCSPGNIGQLFWFVATGQSWWDQGEETSCAHGREPVPVGQSCRNCRIVPISFTRFKLSYFLSPRFFFRF